MLTKEEICEQFYETSDAGGRFFLFAQLLTEIILIKELKDSSEEEYFEGLIFSTKMVSSLFSQQEITKKQEIKKAMGLGLLHYFMDVPQLSKYAFDFGELLINRYNTLSKEISKMKERQNYMIPFLIYNMYIHPMNGESLTTNEVMSKIDTFELIKYSIQFKIKYKIF